MDFQFSFSSLTFTHIFSFENLIFCSPGCKRRALFLIADTFLETCVGIKYAWAVYYRGHNSQKLIILLHNVVVLFMGYERSLEGGLGVSLSLRLYCFSYCILE